MARRIARMLGSFNAGRPYYFVAPFSRKPDFNRYNGTREAFSARSPKGIANFVQRRHRAGDVWTARALQPPSALLPPSGGVGVTAIYSLRLRVAKDRAEPYTQGVKVIVVCSSGRITTWGGPAAAPGR